NNQLRMARKTIHAADPSRLLARGYAIARVDDAILTDPRKVLPNKPVMVQLHQGTVALYASERGTHEVS
ncbi:MAG: hypothetical protein WCI47_01795, partial [bacterium]